MEEVSLMNNITEDSIATMVMALFQAIKKNVINMKRIIRVYEEWVRKVKEELALVQSLNKIKLSSNDDLDEFKKCALET